MTDLEIILVNDCSTDNSIDIIKKYDKIKLIQCKDKAWNGGSRNLGLKEAKGKYILFLDSDDWFHDKDCIQLIYDTIIQNNYPDCVSLSYNCLIGNHESYQPLIRNNIKDLVNSVFVACWTKCIKRELLVSFAENTLMEDVVQHIAQCDKINTIVSINQPIIVWNRNNTNSCSREENQNCQKGKWQSSMYRYAADLMDLQCQNNDCEAHRQWRLSIVLNNIKEGKYIQ